jgi:hypothetical protein
MDEVAEVRVNDIARKSTASLAEATENSVLGALEIVARLHEMLEMKVSHVFSVFVEKRRRNLSTGFVKINAIFRPRCFF